MGQLFPISMRRLFPAMAVVTLLFLVAGLVVGSEFRDGLTYYGFIALVFTHCMTALYLNPAAERVEELAIEGELPDWVPAQMEKNLRKCRLYGYLSMGPFMVIHISHHGGWIGGAWFAGLLAFNLAFQVGAFVGEFAIMAAQARSAGDVEVWAKTPDARPVDSVA